MAVSPKDGKLIYHLTSIDNLEGILKNGLTSRNDLSIFDDVAEREIILHRETKGLNSFVPFHFFAGTPFDGAVQNAHRKKEFVFISIKRVFAEENNFKVLTQHPLSIPDSLPLSYKEGIETIDWDTMELRDYSNHKCAEICMAECLSPNTIKPTNFFSIYTPNESVKAKVITLRNKIVGNLFHVDINEAIFVK